MSEPAGARQRRPPPKIPGYRIEEVLGSGATGVVYRATQLSIERPVALKVLHPESVRNAKVVSRLQREARTAARLKHPNIISAIDMGQAGDTWWFAMELVEGQALSERLEHGGRLPERTALSLFIPLCDALQHASEHGVVHRDVKPANILLEADGRPRLVDLGLARVQDDPMLTRTGATLGTPHYVSPEQARDPACADVRSDIWSLGATMYHAVCGRPPLTGESAAEILSAVLYGPIPDPRELRPELSKGLALVLRKCLSRDPEKRYFAPAELEEDLERVRDHKPPAIRKSSLEPLDPRARRDGRRAAAWAGLAVSALATLALVLSRPWEAEQASPDGAARAPVAWEALESIPAELEAGRLSLAAAWAEREALCALPPAGKARACEEMRVRLAERLDAALRKLWRGVDAEAVGLIDEHRFDELASLLATGLDARLRADTGFLSAELPGGLAVGFRERRAELAGLLERSRASALDSLRVAVERYCEQNLAAQVERLRAEGRWDEAYALLGRGVAELVQAASADRRGFDQATLVETLATAREGLARRARRLEREWRELDQELAGWLDERAVEYERRLALRELRLASEALGSDFEARLAERGLELHALPAQPFHSRARARYEKLQAGIVALEESLIEADAEARLAELDARARPLLVARDYGAAAELWREHATEQVLAPLERAIEIRREEALALEQVLLTAVAGVSALDGERQAIPVGTLSREGRVQAERDPLAEGFRLRYSSGTSDRFFLRAKEARGGRVLEPAALDIFVMAGAPDPADSELALRRALLQFHEGELEAARALLEAAKLSSDDYLVHDLRLRLVAGLEQVADERAERAAHARRLFESVTGRQVEGDPRAAQRRVDELLDDYSEFLSPDEQARLRELRRDLGRGPEPSTVEEFRRTYRIAEIDFSDLDQVTLSYSFGRPTAGTWEIGDWHCDNLGWVRARPVATTEELERNPAPTLHLVDPFVIEGETLEVELVFDQPEDSQPDLFVVSACGFHVAFSRPVRSGGAPLCHVGTAGLHTAIERARAGQGEAFEGFRAGARHTVRLRLNQQRGQAWVEVDGLSVAEPLRREPGVQRSRSVSLRSLEPVRLVALTLRGGRR